MAITTVERDPSKLDHGWARTLLRTRKGQKLSPATVDLLRGHLDILSRDAQVSDTSIRRIMLMAADGDLTQIISMACVECDARRLSARSLADIILIVTHGRSA